MRICFLILLVFLLPTSLIAQKVRFEKYVLDNGMQVILHEDHSLPVACVNIWYRVGSKDERPARSGFAHLFEHLMFMGTKRVPGSSFDEILEAGGGWSNATTGRDRTNYFSFGPSTLLPTLLWLDADRLEALGTNMDQTKLDRQREVVRNERRENIEMLPYGMAALAVDKLMYPPDHPYHRSVIGSHEDLAAASVKDVKDFFARYYVPNNASLVVAGDFDPARIKKLIQDWFGSLPRKAEVPRLDVKPASLSEVRRASMTDRVQFAKTSMVWHSPAFFADGDAAMDLLAAMLADGKSSRLYKRLVYDDKLATNVVAYQESRLHGSLFRIEATARKGVSLAKIEEAIDQELRRFTSEGPSVDELERRKAALEHSGVTGLQSLTSKANRLNLYNFYLGTPDGFNTDLERYRKATGSSVRKWAEIVLDLQARLILRVLPKQETTAKTRDERPTPEAGKSFTPPNPAIFKLSNGITVHHWARRELPLVELSMQLRGGAVTDGKLKSGRASLMASMLEEGAGPLGALEYAAALERLGASVSAQSGYESIEIDLSVLKSKFDRALPLYADAVRRPRFEEKEWNRVKRLHIQALKQAEDRASSVGRLVGSRVFFGDEHPYGRPVSGTAKSCADLQLSDIRACYERIFFPHNATIFIAGDLSAEDARASLELAFSEWTVSKSSNRAEIPAQPAPRKPKRVVFVHKEGAVQTVVRIYMPGPNYASPERINYNALNTILGGSFTSRLNQNLREKHGYTYSAGSAFVMTPRSGYFIAVASVQAKHTGASIKEFFQELTAISKGNISKLEARKARATNRQGLISALQGLSGILDQATRFAINDLPFAQLGKDMAALESVSNDALNTLAESAFPLDEALLVLVGDRKVILEQLSDLGLPKAVELTVRGDPKARKR